MPFHQPGRFACRASCTIASVSVSLMPYSLASSLMSPGDTVTRAVSIRQTLVSDHSRLAATSFGVSPAASRRRSSAAARARCGTVGIFLAAIGRLLHICAELLSASSHVILHIDERHVYGSGQHTVTA